MSSANISYILDLYIPTLSYTTSKGDTFSVLGGICKFILFVMADNSDDYGEYHGDVYHLIARTDFDEGMVWRSVHALEANGYIRFDEKIQNYIINIRYAETPPCDICSSRRKAIPKALRQKIYERDGFCCVECRGTEDLSIDHIVPVICGGDNSEDNLQTLCRSCNSRKGTK